MLLCPRRPGPSSGSLQGWGRAPTTARQRPAACCGHLPASHRRLESLQASGNVLDSLLIEAVVKEILFKVTGIRAQLTLDLKPPGTLWGLTQGHVSLLVWVLMEFSVGPHSETGSTRAPAHCLLSVPCWPPAASPLLGRESKGETATVPSSNRSNLKAQRFTAKAFDSARNVALSVNE